MRKTAWSVLSMILLGTTVLSIVTLIEPTLNYVEFYITLQQLSLTASNITFSISEKWASIHADLNITNPTSYSGLKLRFLGFRLYFLKEGEPIELVEGQYKHWWYPEPGIPFESFSNIAINDYSRSFDVNDETTQILLQAYYNQSRVNWLVDSFLIVYTFLGSMKVYLNPCSFNTTL